MSRLRLSTLFLLLAAAAGAQIIPPGARVQENPNLFLPAAHPASSTDKKLLIELMQNLTPLDSAYASAQRRLDAAIEDGKSWNPRRRYGALEREASAREEFRSTQLARNRAYENVILKTIDAYGLTPPVKDLHGSSYNQSLQAWRPRFSETEITKDHTARIRKPTEAALGPVNGRTDPATGRIFIHASGFTSPAAPNSAPTWSPDALASIIFHETAHWVHVMSRDGAYSRNPEIRLQAEAFALRNQSDFVAALGYAQAAAMFAEMANTRTIQARDAKRLGLDLDDVQKMGWLHGTTGLSAAAGSLTDDEFASELERIRTESAQRAARLIPALQPAGPAADEAPHRYSTAPPAAPAGPSVTTDNIVNITIRACRGEWPTPDTILDYYRLSSDDVHYLTTYSGRLTNGCPGMLLSRILAMKRAGESIGVERLQAEATPLLPPQAHDGTWEREPSQRPRDCVQRGVWYKECY